MSDKYFNNIKNKICQLQWCRKLSWYTTYLEWVTTRFYKKEMIKRKKNNIYSHLNIKVQSAVFPQHLFTYIVVQFVILHYIVIKGVRASMHLMIPIQITDRIYLFLLQYEHICILKLDHQYMINRQFLFKYWHCI